MGGIIKSTNGAEPTLAFLAFVNDVKNKAKISIDLATFLKHVDESTTYKDVDNKTLLHHAALNNHVEVAKLFIKFGLDVNAQSTDGQTPLHIAAIHNRMDIVEVLLDADDVKIYLKTHANKSAVDLALANKHERLANGIVRHSYYKPLRKKSPDTHGVFELEDKKAQFSKLLLTASYHHDWAYIKILLSMENVTDGMNFDESDNTHSQRMAIHYAARHGSASIVKKLLELGANVNAKSRDGWTALHLVASNNHASTMEILLSKLDINLLAVTQDKPRATALFYALENEHLEISKQLFNKMKHELSLNTAYGKHPNKWTLLHFAARYGLDEMAEIMLRLGADPNARAADEWTPLHLAAANGHAKIVSMLLYKDNTQISLLTDDGDTANDCAIENNHLNIKLILKRHEEYRAHYNDNTFTDLHEELGFSNEFISSLFSSLERSTYSMMYLFSSKLNDPLLNEIVEKCKENLPDKEMLTFLKEKLQKRDADYLKENNDNYIFSPIDMRLMYCIDMLENPRQKSEVEVKEKSRFCNII